jgi:hypothetical protein
MNNSVQPRNMTAKHAVWRQLIFFSLGRERALPREDAPTLCLLAY